MHWDDATRTLTIGARQGSYAGMAAGHTFNVVVVTQGHGVGVEPTQAPDKTILYSGVRTAVRF
jgi:alpha-D-xyloside xylohydrolase